MRYGHGHNPFKPQRTAWHDMPKAYRVTHDDGEFILTSPDRLDYRSTIQLLKEQGYKHPYITYIGKDVSM